MGSCTTTPLCSFLLILGLFYLFLSGEALRCQFENECLAIGEELSPHSSYVELFENALICYIGCMETVRLPSSATFAL